MRPTAKTEKILWTIQAVLAALFLFAGATKLALPIAELTKDSPLPGWFVRFIGVAEVAGALGLILPGVLRIKRGLTPLAAVGLTAIMVGATVVTIAGGQLGAAAIPFGVGVLLAFVGWRRTLAWARPLAA